MDASEMLRQQEEELQRIRAKRNRPGMGISKAALRKALNIIFVLLSIVGLSLYYLAPEHKDIGFMFVLIGMGIKVIEYLIRFLG